MSDLSRVDEGEIPKVDEGKLVQDVLDLVNIDSPTGKEAEMAEAYSAKLRALGMKVTLQEVEPGRYNVVGYLRGDRPDGATLMFNGHMDTSFAASEDPEILKAISPVYRFEPPWGYVKDNFIYGMGSFNMKGALGAYAGAVRALQDSGYKLGGNIIVAGVVGEIEKAQIDSYRGPQYRGYGSGTSYLVAHGGIADVAILGEPTGLRLMLEHSGSCWFKVGLKGALVHTGHSLKTRNAILQLNRIVSTLEEWIPKYQAKYTYRGVVPPVNIGAIEGGWPWRASRTPAFANLYVDLRFPPPYTCMDVKQDLEMALQPLRAEGIYPDVELYVSDPWSQVDGDEYIARSIEEAHNKVLGRPLERVYFSWSSDANVLTRHGVIAVNYGPSGGVDVDGAAKHLPAGLETRGVLYIPNLVRCTKVYTLVSMDVTSKGRKEVRKAQQVIRYANTPAQ